VLTIASRFPVEWGYTKSLDISRGYSNTVSEIQPISNAGHACFLPAFFPYKVHINNNEPGHSYHIYTYGPLIY
jgi:hypothetical protein